jgi:hypothetical protein
VVLLQLAASLQETKVGQHVQVFNTCAIHNSRMTRKVHHKDKMGFIDAIIAVEQELRRI